MLVVGPLVLGETHVAIDPEHRLLAIAAQAQPCRREALGEHFDQVAERLAQLALRKGRGFPANHSRLWWKPSALRKGWPSWPNR